MDVEIMPAAIKPVMATAKSAVKPAPTITAPAITAKKTDMPAIRNAVKSSSLGSGFDKSPVAGATLACVVSAFANREVSAAWANKLLPQKTNKQMVRVVKKRCI